MNNPSYAPAVDILRDGVIDQRFYAIVSLFDKDGETCFLGEHNNHPFFLRSLMKPLQASVMANFDIVRHFDFIPQEIAIMQASHAGEKIHTGLIKSILNKIGLKESNLLCPIISPLNSGALAGQSPSKIHNNCSGKHSMFLSICKKLAFSLESYNQPDHPSQKIILEKVVELSGYKNPPLSFDGCTLPVCALPFENIAKSFFKLYTDKKYNFLKEAYANFPYIIGGMADDGLRQDTQIMQLNPKLISKTGAGGFLSVYNDELNQFLLIKMSQDNNFIRRLLALKILEKLNWIEVNPCDYNFYDEKNNPVGEFIVNAF